ncbi:MAG: flagellar biosynthesis protein FlhA [Pseudomonadota bacterium]|nr:flagellar biosynthesis protein FlhA [Pseudomonadota bacterium]
MSDTARVPDFGRVISTFAKRSDIALAIGIMTILVVLILPMPSWMLDFSLAISITFSVLILMTVLFIERPLDFSSFPSVLLIATLLRLSLNLASTRLILANGHQGRDAAGHVIEAFGDFVMGGNFIIGVIVFAILVIVNFVVITKGSGRIAEVAARFSLDAMPGKQMAIDADLSSGLIDENEARTRRKDLESESSFFGAMDGAAKFVRGDAIAGLLITFINIIGGIIIGTAQQNMTIVDAVQAYSLLTVGDGLVSQIPALIVSVAAGMLVSRAGVAGSADKALIGQLSNYPSALGMSAAMATALALLPGIPFPPFFMLAAILGSLAYMLPKQRLATAAAATAEAQALALAETPIAEEPIGRSLAIDYLRLELGYGLLPMVGGEGEAMLADQIRGLRKLMASEMGFILPSVRIQDNLQLPQNSYVIRIKEIEAGRGDIRPHMLMCMHPQGDAIALPGETTREPTFGLPALWIAPASREEAHFKGYTVVDPPTVITTHLTELVKEHMSELLTYTETRKLLDELDSNHQKLVADVIPTQITIGGLQRILQNLLAERISIRDMPTILEAVSEAAGVTRNVAAIIEHVRARLARQLCDTHADGSGLLPLIPLSPEWEQRFAESLTGNGDERQLSMAPSHLQNFIGKVREIFEKHAMMGEVPVLLTSPGIRPYVRSVVERFRPQTVVMSQNEIHPKARIKTMGQI